MELFGLNETKAKLDCDDINLPDKYIFNKDGIEYIDKEGIFLLLFSCNKEFLSWTIDHILLQIKGWDFGELTETINSFKNNLNYQNSSANRYTEWKSEIFNKLKVLSNKINKNLGQTIYYIIEKIENNYIIEFSEYKAIYQFEQEPNASNYVLDIVEYFDDLRELYEKTLLEELNK